MEPIQAITTCFTKYADFKGRARRSEYWYFFLFYVIASTVISTATAPIDPTETISNVFDLLMTLPLLAAGVRRLHDVEKSGWFILVPFYNIVLLATDSFPVDNQYGPRVK